MSKFKTIWTVIWSHDETGNCVIGEDTIEPMRHFLKERDAREFAAGKHHHGFAAEPFRQDVPLRLIERWGL